MSKRTATDSTTDLADTLKNGERAGSTAKLGEATLPNGEGMGDFEDPFEDEIESDDDVVEAGENGVQLDQEDDDDDDEDEADGKLAQKAGCT